MLTSRKVSMAIKSGGKPRDDVGEHGNHIHQLVQPNPRSYLLLSSGYKESKNSRNSHRSAHRRELQVGAGQANGPALLRLGGQYPITDYCVNLSAAGGSVVHLVVSGTGFGQLLCDHLEGFVANLLQYEDVRIERRLDIHNTVYSLLVRIMEEGKSG